MTETDPSCLQVRELAPDLALGLLVGEERASALAHLRTCPACRAEVQALGATADALLLATPPVEPDAGFEQRVLLRFDRSEPVREAVVQPMPSSRRRTHVLLLGMAAAVLVMVGALVAVTANQPGGDTREAAMVATKSGKVVGQATLTKKPAGILVAVPGWAPAEGKTYALRVMLDRGRTVMVGSVRLDEGYGGYGLEHIAPGDVRSVELLTEDGSAVCSGTF